MIRKKALKYSINFNTEHSNDGEFIFFFFALLINGLKFASWCREQRRK